ncbi:MAG TPA: amidohydrolase [Baekduia sp.]|nr:amidohydrolase [Baekduia sp.]
MSADLAILGARIRTLDPGRPHATAVAMEGGTIVAVGSDDEVRAACDARTEVLDGRGIALVPGLTDSHLHPLWATAFAVGVDTSGCRDRAQLEAALQEERRRIGPDAILRAWAVDYAHFPEGLDGRDLERMAGGPALAVLFDLHTYLATPGVLAMAGVTGPEEFADASEIVVRDGVPTGELREFSAFFRVADRLPGADAAARRQRIIEVLGELNALGLTGGHVMDGDPQSFATLRDLESTGDLTLRFVVPLWMKPEHDETVVEEYLRLAGERGDLWRGGAAKFFIDGVVETGTAWLEEPDTRGAGGKPFWPSEAAYAETVARFARAGFQCITHAVGDRAVRAALDAYKNAGPPAPGRGRHRIEHLETLSDATLARLAPEGVAASMQPLHMQWRQPDGSDEWAVRLGPERAARAFRAGDVRRSGATLPLGSDWPVASSDPRYGMAWARLRRHPGRPELPAFEPEQALDAEAALAGYTTAAAEVVGEQDQGGRIAPGLRADLTGFAADPVETPADELVDLPVRLTVVGGRVVFRAEG